MWPFYGVAAGFLGQSDAQIIVFVGALHTLKMLADRFGSIQIENIYLDIFALVEFQIALHESRSGYK